MKSVFRVLFLYGLFPLMGFAQESGSFQKGLEATDPGKQIELFTISIDSGIDLSASYFCRASARLRLGDIAGAIADYSKCIELDPDDAEAFYNRGMAKQRVALDHQGAIDDIVKSFELDTANAKSYVFFIDDRFMKSACSSAKAYYDKVLRHFELNASICIKLGFCCLESGEYPTALGHFTKAAELAPARSEPLLGAALAFYYRDDAQKARAQIVLAKQMNPLLRNGLPGYEKFKKDGLPCSALDDATLRKMISGM